MSDDQLNAAMQDARQYARKLLKSLRMKHLSREDAEQEACVGVLKAVQAWDAAKLPLPQYTRMVVRHQLLNWVRQEHRATNTDPLPDDIHAPEVENDFEEIIDALESLPAEHYALLRERFLVGRTLAAIGSDTGISRQAVNLRQQAALSAIRKSLGVA